MWETPASALAVLWRQWRLAHGDDTAMPLETIERIDNAAKDNH